MDHLKEAPDYLQDDHLSRGTKAYLKVLNGGAPVESLPVGGGPSRPDRCAGGRACRSVGHRGVRTDGRKRRVYAAPEPRPPFGGGARHLPAFVFIHGGGWVLGDYPTHRRLVRDLVVESGCAAVFVNYTPSPEAHFPKAVEEVYAAVKWVAENGREIGVDGSRLALAGNSVGGNMSLAAALVAEDHGGPRLRTLVLMWPVTDAGYDWDSYVKYGRQRFLTAPLMKWMFGKYVSDPAQRGNDLMSPVRASAERLRGLPATLIVVAENDILRDEGEAMGRRLDEAGVEVTTVRFNGVVHDWGMLNGFAALHPTRTLIRLVGSVLRDYLEKIGLGLHWELCRAVLKQAGGAQQADGVQRRAGRFQGRISAGRSPATGYPRNRRWSLPVRRAAGSWVPSR